MSTSSAQYPPFAVSLFQRHDGYSFGYKVLGREHLGAKTPLVLVQGLSAVGLVDWLPLAQHLGNARPVLIFDNRGMGSSKIGKGHVADAFSIRDMSMDVISIVKVQTRLGWNEIDLLGFSMGGMIAQAVLVEDKIHRSFKIRHALLFATSAKAAHSDLLAAMPKPTEKKLTLDEKKELIRPFIRVNYDPKFVASPRNHDLLERRTMESVMTRRPARTIAHQMQAIAKYDVRKQIPSVPTSTPVLVVHGTEDRSVYFTELDYILRGIKHAQVARFGGMGHSWADYYTPQFWTEFISAFCDDQPIDGFVKVGEHGMANAAKL
ncbi:BQ5605_C029g10642 [Microbotryum silenes-dioicae]|uniref:BQ5605_C029g10642 protein n=2 Tax=Microbotryum TaxID=34416 RepID=A0A2X0MLR5_9BASI|nr:BQ5605_C029g10642 [Microbotryum silenes-dioicae]